jgi:tetratricopeptide (TPR) repeat protein
MDATRFAAVSFAVLIAPLAGIAEDDAGTVAAKIVNQARALKKADKGAEAEMLLREAAATCEERLKPMPADAQARFALAQLQFQLEQDDTAKLNLEQAMAAQPNCAAMHAFQGHMLAVAKDFAAAEMSYRRALALNPQDTDSRTAVAICLVKLGRNDEALIFARETVRLAPTDFMAVCAYAGMVHDAGNKAEWERVLKSAIESNPQGVEVREFYAVGLFCHQRFADAYAQRVELARLTPDEIDNEIKLLMVATAGNMATETKRHWERMVEFRRTGKFTKDFVPRELLAAASKKVMAFEYFESRGEAGYKYAFSVRDKDDKEEFRIVLGTYDKLNEHFRSQGKLKESERVFSLDTIRGEERQHYGIYPTLPTYEQTRALAIEIIEGTRLPNAPSANAERSAPNVR